MLPFHLEVRGRVPGDRKPEPLVEATCPVPRPHVKTDRPAGRSCLGLQSSEKGCADSLPAYLGEEREIDHTNLAFSPVDKESSDRLSVYENQVVQRLGKGSPIVLLLSLALHGQEGVDLLRGPPGLRHFLGPGACIELAKQIMIAGIGRQKGDRPCGWRSS